ncbi:MAG: glutamate formimidoyltransferase [candidate division Zixibacteria bacterium]|nr:glutamate formimidoyltransferase [candidate division Zixibacteria bacterium]
MAKIVECVPNFSEGRRPEVIGAILGEIKSVPGVLLLDREMDKDHNRAVVTFVGGPEEVRSAAFKAIAKATQLIDMEKHQGEHPRMGATDVVPFIPISEVTQQDCVVLAEQLGKEVGEKLQIPVYLYEAAAKRPDRVNLAQVRKGEYEGIKVEIETNPDRKPDFGPPKMHPSAGAVAIGARMFLIAFNVYLGTPYVGIAKKIAKSIRFSGGGFRFCKALGFEIKERGLAQISMNLVNYKKTTIFRVFEMIKAEAERFGVPIVSSEIVGLTPQDALLDVAEYYLRLENFKKEQVLENKLMTFAGGEKEGLKGFIDQVASSSPAPGGGSVSAACGALAGALSSMVCRLTIGKKKFKEVTDELKEVLEKAEEIKKQMEEFIVKDAESFDQVMDAMKLPKYTDEEKEKRNLAIQEATKGAISVPLQVMERGLLALKLSQIVVEKGNPNMVSDAGVSALTAKTALEGAYLNVRINLNSIDDQNFVTSTREKADALKREALLLAQEIERKVEEKLTGTQ